jgi:hypothetical protein
MNLAIPGAVFLGIILLFAMSSFLLYARMGNALHGLDRRCPDDFDVLVYILGRPVYVLNTSGKIIFFSHPESIGWDIAIIGQHFTSIIDPTQVDDVSRECVLPSLAGKKIEPPKLFDERRGPPRITRGLKIRFKARNGDLKLGTVTCSRVGLVSSSGRYDRPRGHSAKSFSGTIGVIEIIEINKE